MNTTQQIWHILRKDIRAHRYEIASLVLLNVLLVLVGAGPWTAETQQSAPPGIFPAQSEAGNILSILLVTACLLTIARSVQAESPASRIQLWLTRPYSRSSLVAAKGLFILSFVHLPLLLAQLVLLAIAGIPAPIADLLLNQMVLLVFISLPAMALAALTRNVVQFLLAALPIAAGVVIVIQAWSIVFEGPWFGNGVYVENPDIGIALLRTAIALVLVVVIAGLAVAWQYRYRETRRIALWLAGGAAVTALVLHTLPASLVSWTQSVLIGPSRETVSLTLRSPPAGETFRMIPGLGDTEDISLPIEITGIAQRRIAIIHPAVTLTTDAGTTSEVPAEVLTDLLDELWLHFEAPRQFYTAHGDEEITLGIRFDLKVYEETRMEPVAPGTVTTIAERELCGPGNRGQLICRGALRGSSQWTVSGSIYSSPPAARAAILTRQAASIPFAINPLSTYEYWYFGGDVQPVPVIVRTPSSYDSLRFELDGIRLADWNRESLVPD